MSNEKNNKNNGTNNNNNNLEEMFRAFMQFMAQQQQQTNEIITNINKKDTVDLSKPIEEYDKTFIYDKANQDLLVDCMSLEGDTYIPYGNYMVVISDRENNKIEYTFKKYGEIIPIPLQTVVFELTNKKHSKILFKPIGKLGEIIIHLLGLEQHYNDISIILDTNEEQLINKPIEEQREIVSNAKHINYDLFVRLRNRVCLYLKDIKGDITVNQIKDVLSIYDLTLYDIELTNRE